MPKYRKRPVVIEALQLDEANRAALLALAEARPDVRIYAELWTLAIAGVRWHAEVETLEGTMHAGPGDWLIVGVKDELYPCRDDIFRATYEPVAGTPTPVETGC